MSENAIAVLGAAHLKKNEDDDFGRLRERIAESCPSANTRRAYENAIIAFGLWRKEHACGAALSPELVRSYWYYLSLQIGESKIATATANLRLAALRRLAVIANELGLLSDSDTAAIDRIKGFKQRGKRQGMWLTLESTQKMLLAPNRKTLKGKRDAALLAVLFGCGLRRNEVAALQVGDFGMREARWVLPDMEGKGGRPRTVPVPAWVKAAVDAWLEAAHIDEGAVFRAMKKGGKVEARAMSGQAILDVVVEYASAATFERFRPHDARRTCAKLCRAAGGRLEAIQQLLGHASIMTTSVYLGSDENLAQSVNDAVALSL